MAEDNNSVKNATLAFLRENYPQILPCVPEDVLEFGLPDQVGTILAVLFIFGCLITSVTGNSLMIFLYGRYNYRLMRNGLHLVGPQETSIKLKDLFKICVKACLSKLDWIASLFKLLETHTFWLL